MGNPRLSVCGQSVETDGSGHNCRRQPPRIVAAPLAASSVDSSVPSKSGFDNARLVALTPSADRLTAPFIDPTLALMNSQLAPEAQVARGLKNVAPTAPAATVRHHDPSRRPVDRARGARRSPHESEGTAPCARVSIPR